MFGTRIVDPYGTQGGNSSGNDAPAVRQDQVDAIKAAKKAVRDAYVGRDSGHGFRKASQALERVLNRSTEAEIKEAAGGGFFRW